VKSWRHQVPVHSPLSAAALLAGISGIARNGSAAARQEARVVGLLSKRYGPREVLLTDSGTTALTAVLIGLLRERRGMPIAVPAYGCYDLATAAEGADATVLFYDLDPLTLAPDLAQVHAALRQGVAAVVVVHPYGYPIDIAEVQRLAAETGALVIEDAAQAACADLDGRPVGTRGSLAVMSFGRGKGLTGGSGGAVLAYDDAGVRILKRATGLLGVPRRGWPELFTIAGQLVFERPSLYALPAALPLLRLGETIYREPRPLRRPTPVSSPVIAATWHLAEREVETRRRNAMRLLSALRWLPGFKTISSPKHARPSYLRLPVLVSPAVRPLASQRGARRLGIMPGYPQPLCDLERFSSRCLNRNGAFPGSRLLVARLCTLPTHGRLRGSDLERLEVWIRTVGGREDGLPITPGDR